MNDEVKKVIDEMEEMQIELSKMRERMAQQIAQEIEDKEMKLSELRERLEKAFIQKAYKKPEFDIVNYAKQAFGAR